MMLPLFAAMLMTGCTSEDMAEQGSQASHYIDGVINLGDTRTTLESDGSVFWESSDEIQVGMSKYSVSEIYSDQKTKARFVLVEGIAPTQDVDAYYPFGVKSADGTLTLPAVEHFKAASSDGASVTSLAGISPMYGEYNKQTNTLQFSNLCPMFEITVTNWSVRPMNLTNIVLNDEEKALSGEFTIVNGAAVLTPEAQAAKAGLTLDCGDGVNLPVSGSVTFYVALPAGTYEHLYVTMNTDAYTTTVRPVTAISVERSHIKSLSAVLDWHPKHILDGEFSINADGDKVSFSSGNLWVDSEFASHFENNQWEINCPEVGTYAKADWRAIKHQSILLWQNTAEKAREPQGDAYPTKIFCMADGFNVDGEYGWRLLEKNEFQYMINTRVVGSATGICESETGGTFSFANVNYTDAQGNPASEYGIIIYPDDYPGPFCPNLKKSGKYIPAEVTIEDIAKNKFAFLPSTGSWSFNSPNGKYGNPTYIYYWTNTVSSVKGQFWQLRTDIEGGVYFQWQTLYGQAAGMGIRLVWDRGREYPYEVAN